MSDTPHIDKDVFDTQFAYFVNQELKKSGMSQKDLAQRMNISRGYLGKKLTGHSPITGVDIFRFSIYLGFSVDRLIEVVCRGEAFVDIPDVVTVDGVKYRKM